MGIPAKNLLYLPKTFSLADEGGEKKAAAVIRCYVLFHPKKKVTTGGLLKLSCYIPGIWLGRDLNR